MWQFVSNNNKLLPFYLVFTKFYCVKFIFKLNYNEVGTNLFLNYRYVLQSWDIILLVMIAILGNEQKYKKY